MKKFKIIFATVILGMAIVGGFQAYEYANMSTAEAILLENAEALAGGEINPDCPNGCISDCNAFCVCDGGYNDMREAVWN